MNLMNVFLVRLNDDIPGQLGSVNACGAGGQVPATIQEKQYQ